MDGNCRYMDWSLESKEWMETVGIWIGVWRVKNGWKLLRLVDPKVKKLSTVLGTQELQT